MSSEIELKLLLPNEHALEKIKSDDILARYYKDDFVLRQTYSEYLDTPDWDLEQNDYILRIRNKGEYSVASLKHGDIDNNHYPGLFTGRSWLCYYSGPDRVVSDLLERAAPAEIADITEKKSLSVCFSSEYKRQYTTLYMPDRVRVELTLDEGLLHCDGKSEPLYHMGLELLFGDTGALLILATQLMEHFDLKPELLTKQQRALRLIRSRS